MNSPLKIGFLSLAFSLLLGCGSQGTGGQSSSGSASSSAYALSNLKHQDWQTVSAISFSQTGTPESFAVSENFAFWSTLNQFNVHSIFRSRLSGSASPELLSLNCPIWNSLKGIVFNENYYSIGLASSGIAVVCKFSQNSGSVSVFYSSSSAGQTVVRIGNQVGLLSKYSGQVFDLFSETWTQTGGLGGVLDYSGQIAEGANEAFFLYNWNCEIRIFRISNNWSVSEVQSASTFKPINRCYPAVAANKGNFYLYGGTTNIVSGHQSWQDDLWKFDTNLRIWTLQGVSPIKSQSPSAYLGDDRRFILQMAGNSEQPATTQIFDFQTGDWQILANNPGLNRTWFSSINGNVFAGSTDGSNLVIEALK